MSLATPSPTTNPDSNRKTRNHPKRHAAGNTHCHSVRRMMIRVKSQTTDRGKKLVFTLAICSSTIQCLMDSTMLCKETEKGFNHKEVT